MPGAGIEPARPAARDFESRTPTHLVIRAAEPAPVHRTYWGRPEVGSDKPPDPKEKAHRDKVGF
ncbi:MAG: hypothetical protein RL320_378 [Pseudomonadota bacterium]